MNIKKISFLVVYSFLIIASSGCAVTWNLNEELEGSAEALSLEDSALIELGPSTGDIRERNKNRIVHVKHRDLGIEKGTLWFRDGRSANPNKIYSPPGNLRLRTMSQDFKKPQVEFLAEPGGHYLLSSVCVSTRFSQVPLGFIAIIDANSHQILAVDDFCPDCEPLIGTQLSQWQCGNLDAIKLKIMSVAEVECTHMLWHSRLMCDAAERGIASARIGLGWIYEGSNPALSYYWYRMAEQLEGDDVFIEDAPRFVKRVKDSLTASEINEIEAMLRKHKRGTCENQLFKLNDCCWLHDCE